MFNSPVLAEVGSVIRFAGRVFREGFRPRYEVRELLYQCYVIGYQSLPLVGKALMPPEPAWRSLAPSPGFQSLAIDHPARSFR